MTADDRAPAGPTDPEDTKIIALARAALARTSATQGACVRDTDGRTYAAAAVDLAHLQLSALALAVAMAVSSGAEGLEAAALAGSDAGVEADAQLLADLPGRDVVLWLVDARGDVRGRVAVHGE